MTSGGPPRLPLSESDLRTGEGTPTRVEEAPRSLSPVPSKFELLEAITGSHTLTTDPPAARWLDRRIGRAVRVTLTWMWRTRAGTITFGGLTLSAGGALGGWIAHLVHLAKHWCGP
jgi:hypothetical protein